MSAIHRAGRTLCALTASCAFTGFAIGTARTACEASMAHGLAIAVTMVAVWVCVRELARFRPRQPQISGRIRP